MLYVCTEDALGLPEWIVSQHFTIGAARPAARMAALAASRHGYTGRARISDETGEILWSCAVRGPVRKEVSYTEDGIYDVLRLRS